MSESRRGSVSFTTMPPVVLPNSRHVSDDDIQITLAPYIQTYLMSQTGHRPSCCSVMLPVAFERAEPKSWLDPRFDSAVLEGQYQASVFPQIRLRFRFALLYILLCSLVWMIYFMLANHTSINRIILPCAFGLLSLLTVTLLTITYSDYYRQYTTIISASTAIFLCGYSLCFLALCEIFSPLGHFSLSVGIVLLIYTVIPLRLWQIVSIATIYSIAFEILTFFLGTEYYDLSQLETFSYKILCVRILLQFCVHLIGVHVLIMDVVRMRGTFMKVGQNLLVRRQLEMEKQLKEKMIHSVMPPKVADILLKEGGLEGDGRQSTEGPREIRPRTSNDVKSLFRPFHMHSMDNVSILFADIVGFTKMSSTKTAEQLVEILNDLFERFDDLCSTSGCEKISTLGDCYYCVSGCPEPRPDHAICCVEMGLGMITAMRVFDAQRHEGVKMRVGVHTGTVLCGIVGTRRVKFDVWSNDVTLANKMESSGRPEQVHISEKTCSFLGDGYILEEGSEVDGHRTYFVIGRNRERHSSFQTSNDGISPDQYNHLLSDGFLNGVQLSQSATNLSAIHPSVPPASPVGQTSTSLNPSPILSSRPRLASLNKVSKYFNGTNGAACNGSVALKVQQHPKIIVSTKSLPGSLDESDVEEVCCRGQSRKDDESSEGKYTNKFRNWKVPKFLRKNETSVIEDGGKLNKIVIIPTVGMSNHSIDTIQNRKPEEVPCLEYLNGGYQALPIVIETPCPTDQNTDHLDVPTALPSHRYNSISYASSRSPDNSCSPVPHSMFDDIIDVRSYISQSRSDISPFGRSASYKSQCGRSAQSDVSPIGRPRAATVAAARANGLQPNSDGAVSPTKQSNGLWIDEQLSICASATSRKDSGIRSNSRRSSIQQQIYAMNQTDISRQRVSGYFTSSQSSLSHVPEAVVTPPEQHPDPLAACLQQLRKQSDLQLIRCVRDNAKSQRSYLVKPPLLNFSLFFKSRQMEREFRSKAHRFGSDVKSSDEPPTLATPKYNTYIDIFLGIIVYFMIATSLFLLCLTDNNLSFRIWVSMFAVFSAIQFFALFMFTKQMCQMEAANRKPGSNCEDYFFKAISGWYPWHICLAILMSLPVVLILLNYSLKDIDQSVVYSDGFDYHYSFLIIICIVHFCNFTQLNFWARNILALVTAISFVGLAIAHLNSRDWDEDHWFKKNTIEIYLDLSLILILVWFLNREFEIGYRLTFYGSAVANKDKIRVQTMKNQADMLLQNIIPKHVADQLKNTAKYSENHRSVAIIFASIVNFNELYDESYLGGKEYLRVLNELIGDFDELLSQPEFRCVEKIKTIGSTFMAASGLDPSSRGVNGHHIIALMNFALAMQDVVNEFNKDLLEFNLVLRIGFNVGDVTAGVIGTSKLHYDIWGDAVNVASRMDTTGVAGKIQIGEDCLTHLEDIYYFESRGKVYVKGKDHMEVYLLRGRKDSDLPN